jgi:hypothetical protein
MAYKKITPPKTIVGRITSYIKKNMFFPGISGDNSFINQTGKSSNVAGNFWSGIKDDPKDLNAWRAPYQVQRMKNDLQTLKNGIEEAERFESFLPYRIILQTIFLNTIDNGDVFAAINKRKDLTLLKKFHICDEEGNTDEEATKLLDNTWFNLIRNYIHDAIYYGYSLITFGDMIDGGFPNLSIVRRTDISPDRLNIATVPGIPVGLPFMEGEYFDWSLYVPTPTENGVSKCGYGLLYKCAPYEIILRSLLGWNANYTQRFGMPTLVVKTNKDNDDERDRAEEAAKKLASDPYIILDKQDEFEFANGDSSGTGWKSYDNLETRCIKKISKIILGHEDGITSTPGKLGAGQDGEESPVDKALSAIESKDTRFEEDWVNNHLLPKLIKLGVKIPVGKFYRLKNDEETNKEAKQDAAKAAAWAKIALDMKNAGIKIDAKDFEDKTGLKTTDIVEPVSPPMSESFSPKLKDKLNKVYAKKRK